MTKSQKPRLLLLRHELRSEEDPTFLSPLLPEGERRSRTSVMAEIERHGVVDAVYSSPFLRCLQTAQPYCAKHGLGARVDYALYEFVDDHECVGGLLDLPVVDRGYVPCVHPGELRFPETDVAYRVAPFLSMLSVSGLDTVLVVSHRTVINAILGREDLSESPRMGECIEHRL